ncbi:uncharacterized protein LOC118464590 [Anopheles albimanus]|nr:uncharacterized protein LOC118464590 [Anopheles albimanus]
MWTAIDRESNLEATYQPVITALNTLQMMRENVLQETLDALETAHASTLVDQLTDLFRITNLTINNITGALLQLIGSLTTVQTGAEVQTSLVRLVNTAIRKLVSDVALLNYTIRSAAEGIRQADQFLLELSYAVGNATEATTLALQRFHNKLNQFTEAIESDASCLLQGYEGFEATVQCTLDHLHDNSSEGCVLQSTADTLVQIVTSDFDRMVCVVKEHYESLGDRIELRELLQDGYDAILELGNLLAQSTSGNGPYAILCHKTYASRILALAPRLSDGVSLCLRSEGKRLKSLQSSFEHLLPTVLYDVEELLPSLEVCSRQPADEQEACICEVGELFERLASRTTSKLQLIEQLSYLETNASEDRLKACVLQTTYTVLGEQLARLTRDVQECATSGPNCSQYAVGHLDCDAHPEYPSSISAE